ncbi:very long-chain acyl-CoA synthetase-like [Mizuhopecten yessoensis]|uniref:very long-chain acyl-CoA synthetase-like n=1 Tax=Mizuhopecten yessoensis TaxID=6573 RepID=UPI000B45D3D9|nr:very long-chain acyl-CoA synthetase-like [Mizuhopecten yessoensis]XP_021368650.1 very long-chain acyl-CoA synthetase-like [Mizuhopecten yessoensis]XP_021368652.1 very long-chain acyl-CoA synthetase-like [Mizuhopecten yessoensis]
MPSAKEKVLMGLGGAAGAGILAWRTMFPWIGYDLEMMKAGKKAMDEIAIDVAKRRFAIDMFEEQAANHPRDVMLIFENRAYTFELMNNQACKVANIAMNWGLPQGSTVAIFYENEPAFIWTFLGLLKLGLGVAFLNSNIRSKPLLHSIATSDARILLVGSGEELHQAIHEIKGDLDIPIFVSGITSEEAGSRYQSMDDLMLTSQPSEICSSIRNTVALISPCIYIYTSGTTGLPKPAIVNIAKGVGFSKFCLFSGMKKGDVIYTTTPLYHSAAVLALFCVMNTGATMLLRRKFSASHYWSDCRQHGVTIAQYIGELCRYLLAQPEDPEEGVHNIRVMIGNGLRKDIWVEFQKRFKIPKIMEFFGATEGTTAMVNVNGRVGAVGRMSPFLNKLTPTPAYIVKYDPEIEEPYRNKQGFCEECKIGEAGILIGSIPMIYAQGFYKGGKAVNEKKTLRNVFKKGDAFFTFGDLLYKDSDHFVYFKDRVGDTFRWKGENVSTNEVANVLTGLDFIQDANVYGVHIPGKDGRAGMAGILLKDGLKFSDDMLPKIYEHCQRNLPGYARPLFLRFLKEMSLTVTFKQRKVEVVKEGFDPSKVTDPLYSISVDKKTYVPLTLDTFSQVLQSKL